MSRQQVIANAQNPEGEKRLARILNRKIGWSQKGWTSISLEKLPPSYYLDFTVVRDSRYVEAWLEVKERGAFYGDWLFPLAKWLRGLELAEASGKPFYICFSYPDRATGDERICYLEGIREMEPPVVWAGRKDRGYENDMFPHIQLPHKWFTDITEYKKEK